MSDANGGARTGNSHLSPTAGPGFSDIDLRFARMIATLAGEEPGGVLERTAALLSRARGGGHACLHLEDWAGQRVDGVHGTDGTATMPEPAAWMQTLSDSEICGDGTDVTPLVLEGERIYLYRYWLAERRVAAALAERARRAVTLDTSKLGPLFGTLFPEAVGGSGADAACSEIDRQAAAAVAALTGKLAVISGGPGTGKTTTVARILMLLSEQAGSAGDANDENPTSPLRMAVAAPTGKAAARIGESLSSELERLASTIGPVSSIPERAQTLHRLLGARGNGTFRHDAQRPLPYDVIIVDEASMVDLLLMDALLAAARPDATLVLLGDEDQLASVEAGLVFADLCRTAREPLAGSDEPARGEASPLSPGLTRACIALGEAGGGSATESTACGDDTSGQRPFSDAAVVLHRNYRFGEDSPIGRLATAVRAGNADAALELLDGSSFADERGVVLRDYPDDADPLTAILDTMRAEIVSAATPDDAIAQLGRTRLLCAGRRGPWGVENLNRIAEDAASRSRTRRPLGSSPGWYQGRPVMVTANDYSVGLYNGDVGLCWPESEDRHARIWFPGPDGIARPVAPARLPAHEPAWAMTVHKSQGSEFESVFLILPPEDSPLCTRELIYTGLTRARASLVIIAEPELLRVAIERRSSRKSGLFDALAGNLEAAD